MAKTMAETYWWLGPTIAAFAACLIVWFNYGRQRIRAYRMQWPFRAYLTVAPHRPDGLLYELAVPPNQDVEIQLRIYPRFHYTQFLLIFGFQGDQTKRPQPLKVLNTFIKEGKRREQSPVTDENHYIDHSDNYHIRDRSERIHPNCYALGFMVRTRAPGRYPVCLETITDCGEGKPLTPLVLVVEKT